METTKEWVALGYNTDKSMVSNVIEVCKRISYPCLDFSKNTLNENTLLKIY